MSKDFPFDRESPLVCEGIIGDGCGGGRIFYIQDATLFAFDPLSKQSISLLGNLPKLSAISKEGCIISMVSTEGILTFDLSKMSIRE